MPADRAIALCRCGRSREKPFCDATHKRRALRAARGRRARERARSTRRASRTPACRTPPRASRSCPADLPGRQPLVRRRRARGLRPHRQPDLGALRGGARRARGRRGRRALLRDGRGRRGPAAAAGPGDVLVAPSDAYPGVRTIAAEHLAPRGVEVRLVPSDEARSARRCPARRSSGSRRRATRAWRARRRGAGDRGP